MVRTGGSSVFLTSDLRPLTSVFTTAFYVNKTYGGTGYE
jgi:hypothetical protein